MARLPAAGRTIAVLVAIALAAVATFSVWRYVDGIEDREKEKLELVQVFRANAIIPAGTTIEAAAGGGLIEESEELREQVPVDAVGQLGDLADLVAVTDILPGDIIRAARWDETAEVSGGFEIPEGLNAISAQVGIVPGVAGFINSGDRISIIAHFDSFADLPGFPATVEPDAAEPMTRFLLQDLEVLALGQRLRTQTEQGTVDSVSVTNDAVLVTLAVTEEQAEQLVFAQSTGTLTFTLLPEGFEPEPTPGRRFTNLYS